MESIVVVLFLFMLFFGDDIINLFKDRYKAKAVYFTDVSSIPIFERRRMFIENMLKLGVSSEDAESEATRLFGKKL